MYGIAPALSQERVPALNANILSSAECQPPGVLLLFSFLQQVAGACRIATMIASIGDLASYYNTM